MSDQQQQQHQQSCSQQAVDCAQDVRRLRRENHLLRRQVLRMQEERRVLQDLPVPKRGGAGSKTKGGSGTRAADRDGSPHGEAHEEGSNALHFHHNLNASGSFVMATEDTEALRLRLKTLQRQNDRERLRRQQIERELRGEIERLRLALDQEEPRSPALPHAPPAESFSRSATSALPAPVSSRQRRSVRGDEREAAALLETPPLSLALLDARDAAGPLRLESPRRSDGADGSRRPSPAASSVASSSHVSSSVGGAAELLLTGTRADRSGAESVAVPLASASAADIQRMYQASVDRYSTMMTGGRDAGNTFTGFKFPSSPALAPLASGADPIVPTAALAADAVAHEQQQQQQLMNEADELMKKAADRRAMRRQRLERFAVASASLPSPGHDGDLEGTPLGPRANTHAGISHPHFSPWSTADDDAQSGSSTEAPTTGKVAGTSSTTHAAGGRATLMPVPTLNLANPNQIGAEIKETERNRAWYLKQVIVQALLHAIHPCSPSQQPPVVPAPAAETGKECEPTLSPGNGRATPQPWMQSLMNASTSSSSASDDDAPRDDDDDDDGSRGAGAFPLAASSLAPMDKRSVVAMSPTPQSPTPNSNPHAAPFPQFVYRDMNMTAMQRAIAETVSMHFRCRRNEPHLTPGYREGHGTSGSSSGGGGGAFSGGRLGAFADENTDPHLLEAFAPRQTDGRQSSTANGNAHGSGSGGFDWDDDDDGVSIGPGGAFDIFAANNRSASPGMRGASGRRAHEKQRRHGTSATSAANGETGERFREDEIVVHFHAPVIFSQVRSFLRLDDNYLRTSIAKAAWRHSASPGKSNTTLYYFADFVMKSMKESEFVFFQRQFLPLYVQYCERNPHTLLPKFYAVITVKWLKLDVKKVFILMQNVFTTRYYIHRIYDVKGSTVGRSAFQKTTTRTADGKEESVLTAPRTAFGALLLKDNDLPSQLVICGAYQRAILLAQFRSDVNFLSMLNIVDYSCMIGVRSRVFSAEQGPSKTIFLRRRKPVAHYRRPKPGAAHASGARRRGNRYGASSASHNAGDADDGSDDGEDERESFVVQSVADLASSASAIGVGADVNYGYTFGANHGGGSAAEGDPTSTRSGEAEDDLFICLHGCDGGLLSLPIYAPGDDTTAREDVYYLGIIDVLQEYNSIKKLENFAKGLVNDRRQISVIPPKDYAERLYKVLERIAT